MPQRSSVRPPMPPRNVAWPRSGNTSEASPPACCGGATGCCKKNKTGSIVIWRCLLEALEGGASFLAVLVVFDPQMGDLLFAHQPPEGVFQLGLLDEQVVLGIETRRVLRALKIEREPLLD